MKQNWVLPEGISFIMFLILREPSQAFYTSCINYTTSWWGKINKLIIIKPVHKTNLLWQILFTEDFPGGPVVKNSPSNAGDVGPIPGRGTKIPLAAVPLNLLKAGKTQRNQETNTLYKLNELCSTTNIQTHVTIYIKHPLVW